VKRLTPPIVRWIERSIGPEARVASATRMPPSSTEKHDVMVLNAGGSQQRFILRRYVDAERLGVDPAYDPANEARALRLLEPSDVPAPTLRGADLLPEFCDVPALLEAWVPGAPAWAPDDLDSYLSSTAEVLVAIHAALPARPEGLPDYVPYAVADRIELRPPSWSTRPGLWARVIEVVARPAPETRPCFIHRDYHPGNALAIGDRVVSIVDWATAAWGPPGIDLARMRMNLAEEIGPDDAERFLDAYVGAGGDPGDRHPYWDLLDASDSMIGDEPSDDVERMAFRRFEEWVARTLAEL
jgi:aminoglycoside phosphotransferase (APT) family kinase protein